MAADADADADAVAGGGTLSIQERLYPQLTCFGCGHGNPKGLHLRSYPDAGGVVARFRPWPEHDNGAGFLNGGIIATVLDCHSGAAVYHHVGVGIPSVGGEMPPMFVTAGLAIRYLRPVPLHEELVLRAVVTSADPDLVVVEAQVEWDGKPRAVATSDWRHWRPRPA
jgi:acyl-coenzyme A thioesterase PaaI-like protein